MGRVIFHVDMNSFFASCEIAENPSLKGKKIVIARDSLEKRGIIIAASYEAKREGIYTTQPLYDAVKKVPGLIIVEPRHYLYEEYSRRFFDYFYKLTPLVEPGSIDEGYLDVTDCVSDNKYVELAEKIQKDILELYNLPCSIGIGPNKFLAKMASDMKKPLGITVLRKKDVEKMMWPLPIRDLFGAGKKTCELLNTVGIKTIGDLALYKDKNIIYQLLGEAQANDLLSKCQGNGSTDIDPDRYLEVSSISNAHTYDFDEYNVEKVKMLIKYLCGNVSLRLANSDTRAQTFSLTVKFNNFKSISKSKTIDVATNDTLVMNNIYLDLFDTLYDPDLAVRLVSVACSKLTKDKELYRQLSIFDSLDEAEKDHEVSKVIKEINSLIGSESLKKGLKK